MRPTLLPYSGGKKPMYKKHLEPLLSLLYDAGYRNMISPFIGGGYTELGWILDFSSTTLKASDIDEDLVYFYNYIMKHPKKFYEKVLEESKHITKDTTLLEIKTDVKNRAVRFYLVQKLAFQAFTIANSRISEVKYKQFKDILKSGKLEELVYQISDNKNRITIEHKNFFKDKSFYKPSKAQGSQSFYFIDPPYYYSSEDRQESYGLKNLYYKGHKDFDYEELYYFIKKLNVPFILCYNNHPIIKKIYKGYKQKTFNFRGKEELIITNF